eukprot:327558-Chlamydomonas_euryale.AAC.3
MRLQNGASGGRTAGREQYADGHASSRGGTRRPAETLSKTILAPWELKKPQQCGCMTISSARLGESGEYCATFPIVQPFLSCNLSYRATFSIVQPFLSCNLSCCATFSIVQPFLSCNLSKCRPVARECCRSRSRPGLWCSLQCLFCGGKRRACHCVWKSQRNRHSNSGCGSHWVGRGWGANSNSGCGSHWVGRGWGAHLLTRPAAIPLGWQRMGRSPADEARCDPCQLSTVIQTLHTPH